MINITNLDVPFILSIFQLIDINSHPSFITVAECALSYFLTVTIISENKNLDFYFLYRIYYNFIICTLLILYKFAFNRLKNQTHNNEINKIENHELKIRTFRSNSYPGVNNSEINNLSYLDQNNQSIKMDDK